MIVRVLRAKIRPGKVGAFNVLFRAQVPLLKEQPGLVYVKLARRLQPDGSEEAVLFEEWLDAASLYAWVGPGPRRAAPGRQGPASSSTSSSSRTTRRLDKDGAPARTRTANAREAASYPRAGLASAPSPTAA